MTSLENGNFWNFKMTPKNVKIFCCIYGNKIKSKNDTIMIPLKVAAIFTIILAFMVILQKKSLKLCSDKKVKNDANKSCLIFSVLASFMQYSYFNETDRILSDSALIRLLIPC